MESLPLTKLIKTLTSIQQTYQRISRYKGAWSSIHWVLQVCHGIMGLAWFTESGLLAAATAVRSPPLSPTGFSRESAGVSGPKVGYFAMGWLHLRTSPTALPLANVQWAQPPVCVHPTAPRHLSKVAVGWEVRHRRHGQPYGAGADCTILYTDEYSRGYIPYLGGFRL